MPHRAVLSADNSTLYVTMADSEGPSNGTSGRVYKLATATGTWTNITPNGNNFPYGGVSVDPTNKNRVVVSTVNVWNNNEFGDTWGDYIFLSTDGGSTWTSKLTSTSTLNTNGIGWIAPYGIHWADCIDFDPSNTARVRVMSGNGLYTCDDINASNPSWKFDVKGLEETVPLDLISIPGGPLILGVGDQHGAVYTDIHAYPTQLINPSPNAISGVAYAANNTSKVVMVTDNKINYSTDQGATFPTQATVNGTYGKVALSADGNTTLHCPGGSSTTYYSTNNGATWTSTGVTNVQDACPVADYVNTNKFYIYNPDAGQLLVSTNKGVSFSASSSSPGVKGSLRAMPVPGNEGHVWIALIGSGLKYTTNNGTSWTTVANVSYCKAVGFGKAATGATYPAVYIWGTVSGVKGLFRSTDQGASWTRINDDAHEYGGVGNGNFVIGDMNVYGRAYMGTVGRGLIAFESGGSSCTPTAITPYIQVNGGTWTQTSSATVSSGATVVLGPQPTTGGSWSWSGLASGSTREVTITPTSSGTATATYTNASGCQSTQAFTITVSGGSTTYVTIANRATGLLIDGMGRTSAGDHCGQYASSGSTNQQWTLETSGSYVYIKNRATGLYIDGRGISTNGAYAGQWTSSTSNNLQWTQETAGSYVKFKNRATGLYLDGLGSTTNGADLGQWASSTSNNQQWTITSVSGRSAEEPGTEKDDSEVSLSPNPFTTGVTIVVRDPKVIRSITMIDITGKQVEVIEHEHIKTEQVMGTALNPGLYVVTVNGLQSRQSFKVIKK